MGTCSSIKANMCICLDSFSTIALNNHIEKTVIEKKINHKGDINTRQVNDYSKVIFIAFREYNNTSVTSEKKHIRL